MYLHFFIYLSTFLKCEISGLVTKQIFTSNMIVNNSSYTWWWQGGKMRFLLMYCSGSTQALLIWSVFEFIVSQQRNFTLSSRFQSTIRFQRPFTCSHSGELSNLETAIGCCLILYKMTVQRHFSFDFKLCSRKQFAFLWTFPTSGTSYWKISFHTSHILF